MTLGIAHDEWGVDGQLVAVLDVVLEIKPPFNPNEVISRFAALCKTYGVGWLMGDRYGGLWPASRFAAYGLEYVPAPHTKSELYLEILPLLSSERVRLLDQPRLLQQLLALERRSGRSGKDTVDHPVGSKDDVANCAVGALLLALEVAQAELVLAAAPTQREGDGVPIEELGGNFLTGEPGPQEVPAWWP
jgi:hypothetical protein